MLVAEGASSISDAALVVFGRWVFWPRVPHVGEAVTSESNTVFHRVGDQVARRPGGVVVGTLALLGVLSVGIGSISLGLEEHASFSTQAAWACEWLVDMAQTVLACELVAAVRALLMDASRVPDGPVRELFERAASRLDEDRADRPLSGDLAVAVELVEQGLEA